jgi:hypothetical protein
MRAVVGLVLIALAVFVAACGQDGSGSGPKGNRPFDVEAGIEASGSEGDGSAGVGDGGVVAGDAGLFVSDGSAAPDGFGPGGAPDAGPVKAGTLALDIGGTTQGTDYAFLEVAGKAMLGGELRLNFIGGFLPKAGQKFTLVTAAGGISGAFAKITSQGVAVTPGQDATTFYVTVN